MSEATKQYGQVFSVPRWRMVCETGQGYDELTDEEKRLAREWVCTDQTPAILEMYRKVGEEMGRRHAERVEAAVMRVIEGTP